jgi:regulatory protein YycI of two-component signal transduction system YycFG
MNRFENIITAIAILLSVAIFVLAQYIDLKHQIEEQIQIGKNLDEQIKNSKIILDELNDKESGCGN